MIELPARPEALSDRAVAAWSEPVIIPTYSLLAPDRNPLFLEQRVYQGSSGRVYPNAVTDRVCDESVPMAWEAIHLENQYLRVMVLPAIGGRIHVAMDRSTGYDLFYRQNVIKPALVGLLGPWISGGVELNWPQHHRPSTFMPVDWSIEELPGGGAVVWCSEHEPTERMKGMHGVTLRPGSSLLELQVRLVNRTPLVQTFLWWANAAVRVHDEYEAFFPPDVTWVVDHAKRAVSTFPVASATYYGVDYGSRSLAEADLRWYRNIPVPTSYMAMGTREDFFGGYDHAAGEGFVHWADHAISPGKKLWTWGNHEFGHAWDRELTDADGPYVELMAGVFTDNQPDFSFLAPGEVRTFRQFWYPIVAIGPAHRANLLAATHLTAEGDRARLGVAVTGPRPGAHVRIESNLGTILERTVDLAPDRPFVEADIPLSAATRAVDLEVVIEHAGTELIRYRPARVPTGMPPPAATEPAPPERIATSDELVLTGLHLSQYRHATRRPEDYFREALRRDAGDCRANTALGEWHLRRGEPILAERHLQSALDRLTMRGPNPRDGEAGYLLGLALLWRGESAAADEAFAKAEWNAAFQSAAATARAEMASARGDVAGALTHLDRALASNAVGPAACGLQAALLRRSGEAQHAAEVVAGMLARDPLDARALHERRLSGAATDGILPGGAQTALDVAHDEARAGLLDEAVEALEVALASGPEPGSGPLVRYTLGWVEERRGDSEAARAHRRAARRLPPDYVFPARAEEIEVLESAMAADAADPRAPYYLGNLLYDRRRYRDAIRAWRRASRLDRAFPTVHRNLGIAEFNVLHRPHRALASYRRAFRADPGDARVLYELDQLRKRLGDSPVARLRHLESHAALLPTRDDLCVEYVTLLNRVRRHDEAVRSLATRRFHPWEGGEGLVSRQWVVAHRELAREAMAGGKPDEGLRWLEAALHYPHNLGEGKHLLTPENELQLLMARCLAASGDTGAARECFARASRRQGHPAGPAGDGPYWQAAALRALGSHAEADQLLRTMLTDARRQARTEVRIPYFATSLPTMLLFEDDLTKRSQSEARYLEALALMGLGRSRDARARLVLVLREEPDHLEAALRIDELDAGR